MPFGLRGAAPATLVRLDSSLGLTSNDFGGGTTVVSLLTASYKIMPSLSVLGHFGVVGNTPAPASDPAAAGYVAPSMGSAITNGMLGVVFGPKIDPDLKLGLLLAVTIPVASNGGNAPNAADPTDPAQKAFVQAGGTLGAGNIARASMNGAMMRGNDVAIIPGVDIAWVKHGFTVQGELTFFLFNRVKGEIAQAADSFVLNMSSGLHIGYFFIPQVSLGAEFRYQRFLMPPAAIAKATTAANWEKVSQASIAVGPRFHVKVGSVWLRPAITYTRGFDAPMTTATGAYNVIGLDIPVFF